MSISFKDINLLKLVDIIFQANYVTSKAVTKAVPQCLPPDIIKATGMNAEKNCTI